MLSIFIDASRNNSENFRYNRRKKNVLQSIKNHISSSKVKLHYFAQSVISDHFTNNAPIFLLLHRKLTSSTYNTIKFSHTTQFLLMQYSLRNITITMKLLYQKAAMTEPWPMKWM